MNYVMASALAELAIRLDEQPPDSSPRSPYILNAIIYSESPRGPPRLVPDDDDLHFIRISFIAIPPSRRAIRSKHTPKRRILTNAPVTHPNSAPFEPSDERTHRPCPSGSVCSKPPARYPRLTLPPSPSRRTEIVVYLPSLRPSRQQLRSLDRTLTLRLDGGHRRSASLSLSP